MVVSMIFLIKNYISTYLVSFYELNADKKQFKQRIANPKINSTSSLFLSCFAYKNNLNQIIFDYRIIQNVTGLSYKEIQIYNISNL